MLEHSLNELKMMNRLCALCSRYSRIVHSLRIVNKKKGKKPYSMLISLLCDAREKKKDRDSKCFHQLTLRENEK